MFDNQSLRSLLASTALFFALSSFGGTPENAVLIVDPANAESLYVANYYQAMRGVPPGNLIHMAPGASDYPTFASENLPGFLGTLEQRDITDHIDYVLIPPGGSFYIDAPGLITDPCVAVRRFAISTGYVMAHNSGDILGGLPHSTRNHYCKQNYTPLAFQSDLRWNLGNQTTAASGKRYFIAGMLGYTGARGNTLPEILAMIDRSVAADGTRPSGTFYFMQTGDQARSSPRHQTYPAAVQQIVNVLGQAQHLMANLPLGNHDCLGVMTGLASPDIDNPSFSLLPGSFADHLTSFAGRFDTSSQVKMSRWIAKGASGTAGTVEEPCNYAGKFPHARVHVEYFKGLSMGEAWLRSSLYVPFQPLFYGDPLTRAFSYLPTVDVPSPPTGIVSGSVTITPSAAATLPGAAIGELQLLVDGVSVQQIAGGASFTLDTSALDDGWHELRILAHDDSTRRNTERWIGILETSNHGLAVASTLTSAASGDLATRFDFDLSASGAQIRELRLRSGGRIVAASSTSPATLSVHGQNLGAGPMVRVQAEALFLDGRRAVGAPIDLVIDYVPGTPSGTAPLAFDFTKRVEPDEAFVLELPASFGEDPAGATFTVLQQPARATILSGTGAPYRILQPDPGAVCTDSLTYQVTTASGTSNIATVTLEYAKPRTHLFGCGVNPAGSMSVLAGTPRIGTSVTLGLDDPSGSIAPGALPLVYVSNAPTSRYPCGRVLPGAGELLIRLAAQNRVLPPIAGAPWTGAGAPVPIPLPIPNDCTLIGSSLYAQGVFVHTSPSSLVRFALTDAVRLDVGP